MLNEECECAPDQVYATCVEEWVERTSSLISVIVVYHKHEATQVLCAQNPALLSRSDLGRKTHVCVQVSKIG